MAAPTEGDTQTVRKTEDGRYMLKAGNTEEIVSEERLFQLAQLSFGANRKFEEASNARKDLEGQVNAAREAAQKETLQKMQQVLARAEQGDAAAYEKYLEFLGLDGADKEAKLNVYRQAWSTESDSDEGAGSRESAPLDMTRLPKEVQMAAKLVQHLGPDRMAEILERSDRKFREDDRNAIYTETWSDIAKDDRLSKIVEKGGPRADKLRRLSDTLIRGRIRDGGKYGPDLRKDVVKELQSLAEEFGSGAAETPLPGIGMGPGLSLSGAQAEKRPDRKSITDPDFINNVAEELVYEVTHAGG